MSYVDADAVRHHIAETVPLRVVASNEIDLVTSVPHGTPAPVTEIPPHLLDVPGLVGHLTRWITKTALYPQPLLALGAALTLVGTAGGRKYAGPTKSGTHLYIVAIAPTGAGKNHASKQARRLLRACNMGEHVGPGMFVSDSAVYQQVSAKPLMLCCMDEFGSFLQKINAPKGSGFEKAISGVLRTLWGASFDTVEPPAWAVSKQRDVLKPIHSPAVSIYGMSVHEEFYEALKSADIANGFLNRFLVLATRDKPEEVEPELDETLVPAALIEWMQRIAEPVHAPGKAPSRSADGHTYDIKLDWDCAEPRLFHLASRKTLEQSAKDQKMVSRVPEMAVRLATIRAIGRAKLSTPAIGIDDITWAWELALWSSDRMIADADLYMAETDFQAKAKEVERYIIAAGRITGSQLYEKIKKKYASSEMHKILESLDEADLIDIEMVRTEGARKPTKMITWKGR